MPVSRKRRRPRLAGDPSVRRKKAFWQSTDTGPALNLLAAVINFFARLLP